MSQLHRKLSKSAERILRVEMRLQRKHAAAGNKASVNALFYVALAAIGTGPWTPAELRRRRQLSQAIRQGRACRAHGQTSEAGASLSRKIAHEGLPIWRREARKLRRKRRFRAQPAQQSKTPNKKEINLTP